jgi:hypothetical protein
MKNTGKEMQIEKCNSPVEGPARPRRLGNGEGLLPHADRRKRRRGAAAILVLVGLAVVTLIFLSILKLIAVQRQSVELQTRQVQAAWLADSGVQRARARLTADSGYHGETWNIPAQEIGGRDGAAIVIRVEEVAGKPDRRTIHVEANYPDDPIQRSRQSRELVVPVPATTKK